MALTSEQPELRFAILHHTGIPQPHFDLLFETSPGGALATWRSGTWPITSPMMLVRLDDHRRMYLDYEGEIANRRGHVRRVAGGLCWIEQTADCWRIEFKPSSSIGRLILWPRTGPEWQAAPGPKR